jgi:hypothetical protein
MHNTSSNWKTLLAVSLASIAAAVGMTLAITDGDDDDDDDDAVETVQVAAPSPVDGTQDADQNGRPAVVRDDDVDDADGVAVDPDDQPISDAEAKRVAGAAVGIAGGGTVTDLDRSDDPGEAWEVEVTMANGSELDIALDERLNRVENTSYAD